MLAVGMLATTHASTLDQPSTSRLPIDFQATDLHGVPFHGLSLKGKTVLLDFWAVWCPPCIKAFPVLGRLDRDLKGKGFQVLGIAVFSGTVEDVANFVEEYEVIYQVVVGDEDLVERFGVIGYPTYFLISPEGTIANKYVGDWPNLYEHVKADVAELMKIPHNYKEER